MGTKYYAKKASCRNGHVHDSRKEAYRCDELHLLQKAGVISKLEIQRRFELIPSRKYIGMPNERRCEYKADFVYEENGKLIVEDTKGFKTKDYIIKRKIFKDRYCQNGDVIFKES